MCAALFSARCGAAKRRYALDFAARRHVSDAFDNLPVRFLRRRTTRCCCGRVRATIDPGVVKLTPREALSQTWEFELAAAAAARRARASKS